MNHLRLGFVALRIADLGSQSRYDDAAGEFQWATELQPTWPWGWYGLGLAEDGVGDSQISLVAGLQAMFGKDHLTRAANAYTRSIQVDPSFVQGLVELSATALRQRINVKIDVAREALAGGGHHLGVSNPEVLLYRGRVEREVGDIDSAVAAFRSYIEKGDNKSLGHLELARALFLAGHPGRPAGLLRGCREQRPGDRGGLSRRPGPDRDGQRAGRIRRAGRTQPRRIPPPVLERAGPQRTAEGRRTVSGSTTAGSTTPGSTFSWSASTGTTTSSNATVPAAETTTTAASSISGTGSPPPAPRSPARGWSSTNPGATTAPDGDLVFHFIAREDVQDFKLVESLFDVLGFEGATAIRSTDVGLVANELLLSREKLSPVYSKLLGGGEAAAQRYLTEERKMGRESILIGTTTDSYELRYPRGARGQHLGRRGGPRFGATACSIVSYALRGGSACKGSRRRRGQVYPVRLRLSVADARGNTVARVDTTRLFVAQVPVPEREFLVGRVAVPVPAGRLTYRRGARGR